MCNLLWLHCQLMTGDELSGEISSLEECEEPQVNDQDSGEKQKTCMDG